MVVLMWISLIPMLHPQPPRIIDEYESFLESESEIFFQTLREEDREMYQADRDAFLESHMARKSAVIWIKWGLTLCLVLLGIAAGWLMIGGRSFRWLVLTTSGVFLISWLYQVSKSLSAWDLPWPESYLEFLARGNPWGSMLGDVSFYNQFLVLPILHLIVIGICVFRRTPG